MKRAIRTGILLSGAVLAGWLPTVAYGASAAKFDYIGSVDLRPDRGELSAGWTIQILDPSLEAVSFALSSSFGVAAVSGSGVENLTTRLISEETRRLYEITLASSKTNKPRLIQFAYGGPLSLPAINSLDARKVELTVDSGWYPYEPGLMGRLTAQVGVQIGGDWIPLVIDEVKPAGSGYRVRQNDPSFDIAMSWLEDADLTNIDGYQIYDTRTERGSNLETLKAALQDCRSVFETMIGSLPDASVLLTDRAYEAYSRGTLISLMDIENETDESLFKIVCHELSHHWTVASPGGPDDWINEGFAEYIALMAVRERFGEGVYQSYLDDFKMAVTGEDLPPIWSMTSTARTLYLVSYRAAPLALADLENRMGREAFLAFLQSALMEQVDDTPQLLDHLEQQAGVELRSDFELLLTQ